MVTVSLRNLLRFLASSSLATSLEFLLKLALHLVIVSRNYAVELIAVFHMPFRFIVILVMHDSELCFVGLHSRTLARACLFLCSWLQPLQVDSLKAFDLQLINLGELTHSTATTSMRLALPVTQIISKHLLTSWSIMSTASLSSTIDPVILSVVSNSWTLLLSIVQ